MRFFITINPRRIKLTLIGISILAMQVAAKDQPAHPGHIDQFKVKEYPINFLYEHGKKLFEAPYNYLDGSGRNFRDDPPDMNRMRYSRIPRVDLPGFVSDPIRMSGPGARNCLECHSSFNGNILNSLFDFTRSGDISLFAERQTPNILGAGALQLVAEQTSKELWAIRDAAIERARESQLQVEVEMISSNDVSYGTLRVFPDGSLDVSRIHGVGVADNFFLLSKQFQVVPYYSKGEVGFLRITSSTSPTGLQSPEMYPAHIDGDSDGVVGELSTGDITAITVYSAMQPRPVTKLELHSNLKGKFRLKKSEINAIRKGQELFTEVGCADCHTPRLVVKDATFNEPSKTPGFSFPMFWNKYFKEDGTFGATDPRPLGYDPENPLSFSLTDLPSVKCNSRDLHNPSSFSKKPNGRSGNSSSCWREYEKAGDEGITFYPYSDLKRYDLGDGLADATPSFGLVAGSVWKTKPLWGVGSTGPWLHDGRATTLRDAIRWHRGEADDVRGAFFDLSDSSQDKLITFLENLVIYNEGENAIQSSGMGFPDQ